MGQSDDACLYIVRSTDPPGTIWCKEKLTHDITSIGRLERGHPGVNLGEPWVSRQHAQIVRRRDGAETTYTLEHTLGRSGTRLYAHLLLQPGQSIPLCHSHTFLIPGVFSAPDALHFRLTLAIGKATICPAIEICQPPYIKIFCQALELQKQKYHFLDYLYQRKSRVCPYIDIMTALWTPDPKTSERMQAYHERLRTDHIEFESIYNNLISLLSNVRKEIRQASCGVDLIETINGEGLCIWC